MPFTQLIYHASANRWAHSDCKVLGRAPKVKASPEDEFASVVHSHSGWKLPDMMSATEGGGGLCKSGRSKGGCVNF